MKILYMFMVTFILLIQGCNFLEVRVDVGQRAIINKGDNSKDDYSDMDETDSQVDVTKTILKIPIK